MALSNAGGYKMHSAKAMHINNALLPTNTSPVNGTARSKNNNTSEKLWHSSSVRSKCFSRQHRDDNKSKFSDKLKVLLENGGIAEKIDDPYTFQEVEQSMSAEGNNSSTQKKCNSVQLLAKEDKKVSLPEMVTPTPAPRAVTTATVPVYMGTNQTTSASCLYNVTQSDMLPRHPAEAAKVKSPLLNAPKVAQLTGNSRPFHAIAKPIPKLPTASPSLRTPGSGKPVNFGKSQMSKLAIAKIEKTLESRNKNVSKGTISNSINKTASISKFLPKPKRPAPTRSASLDSDVNAKNTAKSNKNKFASCKSLLEESLLGMKAGEAERSWGSPARQSSGVPQGIITPSSTAHVPAHSKNRHESLQRIWNLRNKLKLLKWNFQNFGLLLGDTETEDQDAESEILYQNYWFSLCNDYDSFTGHNRKREAKLAQLKIELRHKLKQQQWRNREDYREKMAQFLIDTARKMPNLAAFLLRIENPSHRSRSKNNRFEQVLGADCKYTGSGVTVCVGPAMPAAPFCLRHIMHQHGQLLFTPCTASVLPDLQLCGAPALGKGIGSALCAQHQRLQPPMHRPSDETVETPTAKTGLHGKRNRSSPASNRSGRARKRKRQLTKERKDPRDTPGVVALEAVCNLPRMLDMRPSPVAANNAYIVSKNDVDETQDVEVGEEVLAMTSAELATLTTQATGLLEEHEFTNVLNIIPDLAYTFFTDEDKVHDGPTLQETEELERALEAVNNDVESLKKLSDPHGILDMLDEQSIAQTLAALPEVVPVLYQNGFAGMNTIGPLEQTLCDALPSPLVIAPHPDILQS